MSKGVFTKDDLISSTEKTHLNNMYMALYYISPLLNKNLGKAEPPAELKKDGFMAYANGVDWDPAGDGTRGLFWWDTATAAWVYTGWSYYANG